MLELKNPYDLIMFDWNGTLSSGLTAKDMLIDQVPLGRVTSLFPGVKEVLEALVSRGILLGIATAASRFEIEYELQIHELFDLFEFVFTADDGPVKPNPFALLQAMEKSQISSRKTLMVGDTHRDILMAKHAKISALGVSYGVQSEAELCEAGAIYVISEIQELLGWLDRLSLQKNH
jgi:phosphoglycolate phosphatase